MIYECVLGLFALSRWPKLIIDKWYRNKQNPALSERLGWTVPTLDPTKPLIWIHAVSVGEVKAIRALVQMLRMHQPDYQILLTTTTLTGQEEATRSMPEIDAKAILPLDFRPIMQRWVKSLRPALFLLVESDFWYRLLQALRQSGCCIILVNGKMSHRSFGRFRWIPQFTRKLFAYFDALCMQNTTYTERISSFVPDQSKLYTTGNMKLDPIITEIDIDTWSRRLHVREGMCLISLVSTHAPEEEELLQRLWPLYEQDPSLILCVAPRHPERAQEIATHLQRYSPVVRWSQLSQRSERERIILVDGMGCLPICYRCSQMVIVGGSFRADIGGHNVLEPAFYGAYTFFGPHIWAQRELAEILLRYQGGEEITLDALPQRIRVLRTMPFVRTPLSLPLVESPTKKTMEQISKHIFH